MINIDQFKQVEIKVGLVTQAVDQVGSEKLIRLSVEFAQDDVRTIFTGVRPFGFKAEDFSGKKFLFVTNLEFKKMPFEDEDGQKMESQGMILAVDGSDGRPVFIEAPENAPLGSGVR